MISEDQNSSDMMSLRSHDRSHDQSWPEISSSSGGGGGGKGEGDAAVRLRAESELSEVSSSESKSPSGGGGGVERGLEEEVSREEDSWKVWSELLRNWEESIRKQQKTVRQRVREGIPGALRGMAWQLMCGAQEHNLRDRYPELLTVRESLFVCLLFCSVHSVYIYCEDKVVCGS